MRCSAPRHGHASATSMLRAATGLLRRAKAAKNCPRYQQLQIAAAVAELALAAAAEKAALARPPSPTYRDLEEDDAW